MDDQMRNIDVQAAYRHAINQRLYDKDCYMASNESEYWAEGTQSWFDATVRCGTQQVVLSSDTQASTHHLLNLESVNLGMPCRCQLRVVYAGTHPTV